MKVFGKVFTLGEINSGMSANGEWERQTLVIQVLDETQRYVPIEFFGRRKVKQLSSLAVGMIVEVTFRIVGRVSEGRWFATLDGISVRVYQAAGQTTEPQSYDEIDEI